MKTKYPKGDYYRGHFKGCREPKLSVRGEGYRFVTNTCGRGCMAGSGTVLCFKCAEKYNLHKPK